MNRDWLWVLGFESFGFVFIEGGFVAVFALVISPPAALLHLPSTGSGTAFEAGKGLFKVEFFQNSLSQSRIIKEP